MSTESRDEGKPQLVVLDGDDTLWSTMPLYTAAKQRFAALVSDMVSATNAIARLDEVDRKNVPTWGFSTSRFPGSLLECYRLLCAEYGRARSMHIESSLSEIGHSVFTSPAMNVPDVETALMRLSQHFDLVLATKGDPVVQLQRLQHSQLGRFFCEVHVFATKADREFASILACRGCDPARAWSVGNSVRSDINPALRTGMSAVLVRNPTWDYEDEPLLPAPRIVIVNTLAEAVEVIIERSD